MRFRRSWAVLLLCLPLTAGCTQNPARVTAPSPPELPSEEAEGPPLFENVTKTSGIDFTYRNGEDTADHFAILESLGGGGALIDYDGDGLLDVFLTGGGRYAGDGGKEIVGLPCRLYRNLGGGKFKDVTA